MTTQPPDKVRELPLNVELVELGDVDGRPLYGLRFTGSRPYGRHLASHDLATLVGEAWQVHRNHRPSMIDDARLKQIVRSPPLSPARLLCELLALQGGRWIISSTIEFVNRATEIKLQDGDPVTNDTMATLQMYQARSWMSVYLLEGAFDAEEPHAALVEHFDRWKSMLLDYLGECDEELHACIAALTVELDLSPSSAGLAAVDLQQRQRMDASFGVLLANAAAHELRSAPPRTADDALPAHGKDFSTLMAGLEDPFSTRAYGTLGFWCRAIWSQLTDAPIDERVAPKTAAGIVETAYDWMKRWDGSLLSALERVHPLIARPLT